MPLLPRRLAYIASVYLAITGIAQAQEIDVLIKNGTVLDGSGSAEQHLDIGIRRDRIAFLTPNSRAHAKKVIDATELVVSPGFIDPHTHTLDDLNSAARHGNEPYLMQGVTTVVTGNDGSSPIDIAATLQHWQTAGIGTNAALFIGQGSVRREIMGMSDRSPSLDELSRMKALVANGVAAGAIGMSTGLYYAPGSYASTDEVIGLAKEAQARGGVYDTHMRDESTYSIGLLASINETVRIGREAGLPVHISHIKALGKETWGMSSQIIEIIDKARQQGVRITASQYPYEASGTSVGASLLPRWAEAGGRTALLARFQDAAITSRLTIEMEKNLERRGGPESLLITGGRDLTIKGKTLAQIAHKRQTSPVQAAIEIIKAGDAGVASFNMREDDIKNLMRQDWVMTCSDGSNGHPRKYGTFSRKLKKYVFDEHVVSLPFAVRSSTWLPAQTFGLKDRGLLKAGAFADVVVFDPATIADLATYEKPEVPAKGVRYLFVNGQLAVNEGRRTAVLAGRPLTHH